MMALGEGWDIFESCGPHGPYELCVLEEPELLPELGFNEKKFADDNAVWEYVFQKYKEGSWLHRKALEFLYERNPQEYAAIIRWCLGERDQ